MSVQPESTAAVFEVHEPAAKEIPVVVEVPHAGLSVNATSMATLCAPVRALARDADLYVDELYVDAPAEGATLLASKVSRYVCDLNRSAQDVDGLTVEGKGTRPYPHGLIWRSTTDDLPALERALPPAELERRLEAIYRPYHLTLSQLLQRKQERFGYVILLCGHSMPSRGRPGHADPGQLRADVVPGSRGGTSADRAVLDCTERVCRERGWSVDHDNPYKGGFSTGHYGRPRQGQHAIQIEISRRLYMDERTLAKKPKDFAETRAFCRTLVAQLGKLALA